METHAMVPHAKGARAEVAVRDPVNVGVMSKMPFNYYLSSGNYPERIGNGGVPVLDFRKFAQFQFDGGT
jgi:hypothetical protein